MSGAILYILAVALAHGVVGRRSSAPPSSAAPLVGSFFGPARRQKTVTLPPPRAEGAWGLRPKAKPPPAVSEATLGKASLSYAERVGLGAQPNPPRAPARAAAPRAAAEASRGERFPKERKDPRVETARRAEAEKDALRHENVRQEKLIANAKKESAQEFAELTAELDALELEKAWDELDSHPSVEDEEEAEGSLSAAAPGLESFGLRGDAAYGNMYDAAYGYHGVAEPQDEWTYTAAAWPQPPAAGFQGSVEAALYPRWNQTWREAKATQEADRKKAADASPAELRAMLEQRLAKVK